MVDVNLESEEGAQAKADQAQSDAESFAESEVESHRSTETHDTAQPPQSHDNEAHDRDFVDEGEAAAAAPVQSVNGEEGDVEVGVIPEGVIVMWSGATTDVPSGFTLCDGTDGTPDLTDRFVVGAGGQYAPDDTGGADEVQLTEAEMPSHTHGIDVTFGAGNDEGIHHKTDDSDFIDDDNSTKATGGDEPHENRPPYYALAYIMKT